jgi:hypothetical protein
MKKESYKFGLSIKCSLKEQNCIRILHKESGQEMILRVGKRGASYSQLLFDDKAQNFKINRIPDERFDDLTEYIGGQRA